MTGTEKKVFDSATEVGKCFLEKNTLELRARVCEAERGHDPMSEQYFPRLVFIRAQYRKQKAMWSF